MRKIRILHIASFIGNVGDNANHDGFRNNLRALLGRECVFDEIEIRDFYFSVRKRLFDEDFIEEANTYDLVVVVNVRSSFFKVNSNILLIIIKILTTSKDVNNIAEFCKDVLNRSDIDLTV